MASAATLETGPASAAHPPAETRFLRDFAWLAILLAAVIPLVGRALLLPLLPVPKPAIQDEFAYLLGAETFTSGRLTNPTPAMADHFETLQELIRPTYASKYPPFSSLMMAFGLKLFGVPWIGVWLSMGLLCAALCWALQGWVSFEWALVGTGLAIVRIGIVSYWTETYWGGACAAIGGALLVGAVPRLIRRPRIATALWMAAGLAILANTRPYEGVLLTVVCLGYLGWRLVRAGVRTSMIVRRIVVPAAVILFPVIAGMGYYNYRVTGKALEMPYMEHEKQYAVWSPLLWQRGPRPEPHYSNSALRDYWVNAFGAEAKFAHEHPVKAHVSDILTVSEFFLGWPVILCLIAAAVPLAKNRTFRLVVTIGALFYAGGALDARLFPHYAAPATVLIYILAALALEACWRALAGRPTERRIIAAGAVAIVLIATAWSRATPKGRYYFSATDYHLKAKHATVEQRLASEPGEHLVLVQYGPHHDAWEELVYNHADINRSRIIWARSLSAEKDRQLMQYYAGRTIWLVEEDGEVKLKRYFPSTQSTTPTQLGRVLR